MNFKNHKEGCSCNYCRKNKGNAGEVQSGIQYSESKDNIGNMPYKKVDAVVFSPPFADRVPFQDKEWRDKNIPRKNPSINYSEIKDDPNNIGNLKY